MTTMERAEQLASEMNLADGDAERIAAAIDDAVAEMSAAREKAMRDMMLSNNAAVSRMEAAEAAIVRIEEWTHEHGAALHPRGADTYGNGVRDAKEQVATLASVRK